MRKQFTWAELKEFVNALPENVLDKQVCWWGEERGGTIDGAEPLEEDFVCTDEGWEPKSVQEVDDWTTQEDIDNMAVMEKGTPMLYTDFVVEDEKA